MQCHVHRYAPCSSRFPKRGRRDAAGVAASSDRLGDGAEHLEFVNPTWPWRCAYLHGQGFGQPLVYVCALQVGCMRRGYRTNNDMQVAKAEIETCNGRKAGDGGQRSPAHWHQNLEASPRSHSRELATTPKEGNKSHADHPYESPEGPGGSSGCRYVSRGAHRGSRPRLPPDVDHSVHVGAGPADDHGRHAGTGERNRGRYRRATTTGSTSDAAGAACPGRQPNRRRATQIGPGGEPSRHHRRDVGHTVRETGTPDARIPRRASPPPGRKPADAVGEMVTTRVTLQIPGAPTPEVYLAALGPQMLELAGRRSAGTVTWMTGPKTLARHIGPTLREAAVAAGRPADAVRVVAVLAICVTDDVDSARALAAEEFALYGQLPSYRAMLDREGYEGPEDVALIGDEATVLDRLAELRQEGLDELAAYPFGESAEILDRTRALLRTCL